MVKVLENLELVDVKFEDTKAVLTFLDDENGEIREINFNKKIYDNGNWVDSDEKAEKVEGWCQEYFGLNFTSLAQAVGDRKTVFCYDKFNSLFEVAQISKFDEDMLGQILSVEIAEIIDDGNAIKIRFDYDGDIYESKMGYSTFLESKNEWFVNPQKKVTQYEKFKTKFHVSVDDKDTLVGKTVMVEIKKAMGKYIYVEVKPFPKKK